jgi:ATP-dependent RNA helicase DeaD
MKFNEMNLPPAIQKAADDLNYITPTQIQEEAIPWLLDHDTDLIAISQTGTGKTAAFGFPVLTKTDSKRLVVQTIILCPTRELCMQITRDFESYSKYLPAIKTCAVYGGASIITQKDQLRAGVQIVVGTPGRVFDMLRQKVLKLDNLERLILDEADEMLNMGFKEEIFSIMSHMPEQKQVILFSATMPKDVVELTKTFMDKPFQISVGKQDQGAENIEHFYYKVHAKDKYKALKRIVDISPKIYGIVFCRTRNETQEIASKLQQDGYNADALHGDLSQAQRDLVMNRFRSKYLQILVATDVAARGLDVDDLTHIINYEAPMEADIYIHRSGRTARAGKSGVSLTIIHAREMNQLKAMEKRLGREIVLAHVPTGREICEKQLYNLIETMENINVDDKLIDPLMENIYQKLSSLSREELIKKFVSVEFNRFLEYYKDATDLDIAPEQFTRKDKQNVVFSTFKINIGYRENLTKRELIKFINRLRIAHNIEIGNISIGAEDTIVELDSHYNQPLLRAINVAKYYGTPIKASIIDKKSGSPERQYSDRKPNSDRQYPDRKMNDSEKSSSERKQNYSDKPHPDRKAGKPEGQYYGRKSSKRDKQGSENKSSSNDRPKRTKN